MAFEEQLDNVNVRTCFANALASDLQVKIQLVFGPTALHLAIKFHNTLRDLDQGVLRHMHHIQNIPYRSTRYDAAIADDQDD